MSRLRAGTLPPDRWVEHSPGTAHLCDTGQVTEPATPEAPYLWLAIIVTVLSVELLSEA